MTNKITSKRGAEHGSVRVKRKIGPAIVLLLAVLVASALIGRPVANYAGVCLKPLGVLDEEERDREVFKYLKKKNLLTLRGVGGAVVGAVDNAFDYKTFEHFMSENKDCCSYSNNGPLNMKPSLLRRLSGEHRSFVTVRYKPIWSRQDTPNDVIQERSLVISNCGNVGEIYP